MIFDALKENKNLKVININIEININFILMSILKLILKLIRYSTFLGIL